MKVLTMSIRKKDNKTIGWIMLLATIILLTAFATPIVAQHKLGIRGGVNISEPGLQTSIGNTADLTRSFTGIDIGLVSEFKLTNKLAFQTELGYTEKGIRLGTGTNVNLFGAAIPVGVMTTTKIRQLEMPVMAKYQLSKGAFRTYATAGPTLGYALSGNFKTRGTLLADVNLANQNIDLGDQNRFSLGLVGGLGLEVDQGPGTLFVEARYQHQALKINNLPIDNIRFNNNGVGFNVGYKFML